MNVDDNVLTVSSEVKDEKHKETDHFTRHEFNFIAFNRSFSLPENVNAEQIKAEYRDGILHVAVPKVVAAKPKVKEITVG